LLGKPRVLFRIRTQDAGSDYGNRAAVGFKRCSMGLRIDALRKPGYHRHTLGGQLLDQLPSALAAFVRCGSGAHDRH